MEHGYQACKSLVPTEVEWILNSPTAAEAKKRGKKITLRPDWDKVKFGVMYQLVKLKYTQNLDLKQKLLDTGDEELVEETYWHDLYWRICSCPKHNGAGKNNLGKITMKIREELK